MRKTALVTGAAKRIGAACARLLHGRGWNLVLHYNTSAPQALQLCEALNAVRADSAVAIQADLLNPQAIKSLAQTAFETWGGIDALINNASLFKPGALGEIDETHWSNMMDSNLRAPFFLSQALAATLTEKRGCIVNIADIHAEKGLPGFLVYSISKAGLVAMTKCLAKEMAPSVRVNAVAPGAILWPEHDLGDAQKAEILQKVALQRCGEADDIAGAVRFLIEEGVYITGQVLTVDGGRTLFG